MSPSPSHLPDLCLSNIFSRVPLSNLVRSVRVVCSNWSRVVPSELRRRRSLVLVQDCQEDLEMIRVGENPFRSNLIEQVLREDGSPWVRLRSLDQIRFDVLRLPGKQLTEAFTTSLMDTFPTITHLTLFQRDWNVPVKSIISVLEQIVRLINNYRNELFSLKLDIFFNTTYYQVFDYMTIDCTALLDAINQLGSLRHLTLNIKSLKLTTELSILSRLGTFASKCIGTWLLDSIQQYATIGHVRIACDQDLDLAKLSALEPQLANRFSSARVLNFLLVTDYDRMLQFSSRFASLIRLSLYMYTLSMSNLAKCLSSLTELIYLGLYFEQIPSTPQLARLEFAQVTSVRLLSLIFHSKSHLDTDRLYLSEIFVSLQVLDIRQRVDRCVECGLSNLKDQTLRVSDCAVRDRIKQCQRISLRPFRQCAKLHTIKLDGGLGYLFEHDLITVEQFGEL